MSITINLAADHGKGYETKAESGRSVFAGNLGSVLKPGKAGFLRSKEDETAAQISQKKSSAQKQALKLIRDAWGNDQQMEEDIADAAKQKEQKTAELNGLRAKNKDIDNEKETLRQEYGVAADSEEQKDLELLEKYQNNIKGAAHDEFTGEEIARLKELQEMPRTEYQNRVLALNSGQADGGVAAQKLQNEIIALSEDLGQMKIEQARSQGMQKASDSADGIMDAANKEILGMLIQDGKEKIDERLEEAQEEGEKLKEEKEEQQERIDDAKEKREEQQEILEAAAEADKLDESVQAETDSDTNVAQAQMELQRILEENNLIDEDLKGIHIDFGF